MWVIGWLAKREKIEKKMNEFVAYYKTFVNFRNDPKIEKED